MIIDRLIDRIKELENPTVVGLDPRLNFIPDFITESITKNMDILQRLLQSQCISLTSVSLMKFVILYQLLSHRLQCTKDTALRV